jgi:hypothetical protein
LPWLWALFRLYVVNARKKLWRAWRPWHTLCSFTKKFLLICKIFTSNLWTVFSQRIIAWGSNQYGDLGKRFPGEMGENPVLSWRKNRGICAYLCTVKKNISFTFGREFSPQIKENLQSYYLIRPQIEN